jgi:hypothetical protein
VPVCVKKSIDGFEMVSQRPYTKLCWAAVALSANRLRDPAAGLQLCDVVQLSPPRPTGCCGDLTAPECNHLSILLPALQALGRAPVGFLPVDPPNPTSAASMDARWGEIKAEIDNGLVVCVGINWASGGKHYVSIWGYEECDDGSRTLYVKDPWFANSSPSYEQFVTNYLNKGGKCSELDKTI